MKLLKNIIKYGLIISTLGLSSCWNFGDNTNDVYRQKAIEKLPVSEIYMTQKVDPDLDNDDDYIVVGKLFDNHRNDNGRLVGKDKCGIFFLENDNKKFKVRTLEERLDRYPEILNSWIGKIKGQDIEVSIDNIAKKRKKMVLTLETGGKKHEVYLSQKQIKKKMRKK